MRTHKNSFTAWMLIVCSLLLTACGSTAKTQPRGIPAKVMAASDETVTIDEIPEYSGSPYVEINHNVPEFSKDEYTEDSYEYYSELDALKRCGVTKACIGKDIMPTEPRGKIGMIKPSGWQTVKYNGVVDGNYLYNRCHLIGFQLAGENANEKNLITGTRYLNVDGMLPFENEVAEYVKETDNHVMYRVTPIFEGDNLVASGVQMEAESVEDGGKGVSFNVYCYNVQPGIEIDYANGKSKKVADDTDISRKKESVSGGETYIVNKNTHKFHRPDCASVKDIKPQNRKEYTCSREKLMEQGYDPCGRCKP